MPRLLITDDDQAICKTLQMHYVRQGFDVVTAHSAQEGYRKFLDNRIDAVVTDVRMPGEDGFSLLSRIRHKSNVPVIMITAFHDLDTTVTAVQGGATDFVPKPLDIRELDDVVNRALQQTQAKRETGLVFPSNASGPSGMIAGRSKSIQDAFRKIAVVSQNQMPVLIFGEPGTGKELMASAIHKNSASQDHPFVVVNCASDDQDLLERDIFGVEGDSIAASHRGKLTMVGSGTLFLDEISELSSKLQSKLMHVLENHKFTSADGTRQQTFRGRIIAATNRNLAKLVEEGEFREDLYYRLSVVTIPVQPLRERKEDMAALVEHLLRRINTEMRKRFRNVSTDFMNHLESYDWPGNIRELENVLMKAAVMESGSILTPTFFPDIIKKAYSENAALHEKKASAICAALPIDDKTLPSLREVERQYIEKVLVRTNWHKGKTCEILEISRPKLERHIREFNIQKEDE